jgi:cytochrome c553
MKKLVSAVTLVILLVSIASIGCAVEEPAGMVLEDGTVVSSCVGCHTDKDLLKELAVEPEKEASEATEGEG